jgi:hypothetical protein
VRVRSRRKALDAALHTESEVAQREVAAEAAERSALWAEAGSLRVDRQMLHGLYCALRERRCDWVAEAEALAAERQSREYKMKIVTAPLAAARVRQLPFLPQVTALRGALQRSIDESREGIQRTSALRCGTAERCVAHEERLQREREWLRLSMERLAQQRASQARLYVDMTTEMEAQTRCEAAAQHDAQLCAAARATLVPLGEALRQEKAALTAASERERQLGSHAAHLDEVRDGMLSARDGALEAHLDEVRDGRPTMAC